MENTTADWAKFRPTSSCYLAFLPRLDRSWVWWSSRSCIMPPYRMRPRPKQAAAIQPYKMGPPPLTHTHTHTHMPSTFSLSIYSASPPRSPPLVKNHALGKLWPAFPASSCISFYAFHRFFLEKFNPNIFLPAPLEISVQKIYPGI